MARPKKKFSRAEVVAQKPRKSQNATNFNAFSAAMGKQVGTKAVGILVANPMAALVAIIVGIILMLIMSFFVAVSFIDKIMNPWLWALSFGISILLRPSRTSNIALSSIFVGGVFWIYETWAAHQAIADVCSIPILGTIICGTVFAAGWIFNLIMYLLVAFVMITAISYLRRALLNI